MISNQRDSFIKGAVWLTVSAIILKIIGLIYKIPISYLLGDEGMGIFNSAYTVYTFFYIIGSAGIPKAISIITSKYEAECKNSSCVIYRSAFWVVFCIATALTLFFLLLSGPLSSLIGNRAAWLSMVYIAPAILFVTLSGVLRGYFVGRMHFSAIAVSELIAGVFKLVLGILFAYIGIELGYALPVISAFSILGITVGSFASFVYLYIIDRIKFSANNKVKIDFRCCIDVFKLAAPITVSAALGSAVSIIDLSMLMNGLLSLGYPESVATVLYGNYTTLAVPMIGMVAALINPIGISLQPVLTQNYSLKNTVSLHENLNRGFEIVSFVALPCYMGLSFLADEILSVIFEYESAILAAPMLSLLAPSVLFMSILTVLNTALEAEGRVSIPMISLGCGAIAKILIGGLLTYCSEIGILSAPIGTVSSYAVSLCISYFYFKRTNKAGVKIIRPCFKYLVFSLFAILPVAVIKYAFNTSAESRIQSISLVAVYGIVYLLFSLVFSKNARKTVSQVVKMHKKSQKLL